MRGVANFLLNFAKTSKSRCAEKFNIGFVTITCFGSVCHHEDYEGHEVFFRRQQTKGIKVEILLFSCLDDQEDGREKCSQC